MTAVWTYPWAFGADDVDDELARVADAGITGLNIAGHYHSVQTVLPRRPDDGVFESYPGGCHFEPSSRQFGDTDIDPPVNDSAPDGGPDAFELVARAARDRGLDVNAWTVCLHNSRLGAANPEYRIESAFGDPHDHAPCPSHPAVRTYYEGVVRSMEQYGVDRIDLESVGFPTAFHGHGDAFGHLKNHVVTSDAGQLLLSQCFCDGCRAAAADHDVDLEAAEQLVRELGAEALNGPTSEPPPIDELADRYGTFEELLSFRAAVVERFVRRLAAATDDATLNYYLADGLGYVPDAVAPAGVNLERLGAHLDALTAMCYTADPATARERVRLAREAFDGPVHGGVTLDPAVVETRAAFEGVVAAVREVITGGLQVYNHSLLGTEQRRWVAGLD